MRIAVLADIHGNLPAFEAALAHVSRQKVDQVVLAGDIVVGSPDSAACWQLAQSLQCPMLRGNHERYIADYDTPDADPGWSSAQYAPVQWAVSQLADDQRRTMGALPRVLRLADVPDLVIVHASARSDHDAIFAYTSTDRLSVMFSNVDEPFIVRAHNHVGQVRLWGRRLIVTSGSVGLPLDCNPTAQYLLLEQNADGWRFHHQSVPYDVDAALGRFEETGYLEATGPMGRLFRRELATASYHIIPFLRAYARWSGQGAISLEDAVERFLTT
jgi:hypothetical protein